VLDSKCPETGARWYKQEYAIEEEEYAWERSPRFGYSSDHCSIRRSSILLVVEGKTVDPRLAHASIRLIRPRGCFLLNH